MVNNIQLTWKLAWLLRAYRTCNSTVGFSKYEFYNKLLDGIILLRVTPSVTWTQLIYIYIYIYNIIYMHELERCYNFYFFIPSSQEKL